MPTTLKTTQKLHSKTVAMIAKIASLPVTVKVTDAQEIAIANQPLPFLRGYAPTRGIQYSALND